MINSERLNDKEKETAESLNREFAALLNQRENASEDEQEFYDKAIDSFIEKIQILNKSVLSVLGSSLLKRLDELRKPKIRKLETIKERQMVLKKGERITTSYGNVKITKDDKKMFMNDLQITTEEIKRLRKSLVLMQKDKKKKPKDSAFQKPNPLISISARMFSKITIPMAEKSFQDLRHNIRKAGMPLLLSSYLSLMFLSTLFAFVAGIVIAIITAAVSSSQNLAVDLIRNIVVSFAFPIIVFIAFYAYPSSQISSFKTKIDNDLPFAVMHMATIAGSGVEPTRVFQIIALSEDYPAISKEARKIMNQINFYGYDFVSALRETAKTTSSESLAKLLNGMSTIISTGGNLQSYLDQSSVNALLDYKLKRKQYVQASGTYADIYTGLLITAPLLFMLLLSLIKVIGLGMDIITLGMIGITAIVLLNIGFIIFLNVSQPEG